MCEAQSSTTKGPPPPFCAAWIARARNWRPLPGSPRMRRPARIEEESPAIAMTARIASDRTQGPAGTAPGRGWRFGSNPATAAADRPLRGRGKTSVAPASTASVVSAGCFASATANTRASGNFERTSCVWCTACEPRERSIRTGMVSDRSSASADAIESTQTTDRFPASSWRWQCARSGGGHPR